MKAPYKAIEYIIENSCKYAEAKAQRIYLEAAMQAIKMKRADIEELNMAKLFERYKDGYSDQQAQERKDKQ